MLLRLPDPGLTPPSDPCVLFITYLSSSLLFTLFQPLFISLLFTLFQTLSHLVTPFLPLTQTSLLSLVTYLLLSPYPFPLLCSRPRPFSFFHSLDLFSPSSEGEPSPFLRLLTSLSPFLPSSLCLRRPLYQSHIPPPVHPSPVSWGSSASLRKDLKDALLGRRRDCPTGCRSVFFLPPEIAGSCPSPFWTP